MISRRFRRATARDFCSLYRRIRITTSERLDEPAVRRANGYEWEVATPDATLVDSVLPATRAFSREKTPSRQALRVLTMSSYAMTSNSRNESTSIAIDSRCASVRFAYDQCHASKRPTRRRMEETMPRSDERVLVSRPGRRGCSNALRRCSAPRDVCDVRRARFTGTSNQLPAMGRRRFRKTHSRMRRGRGGRIERISRARVQGGDPRQSIAGAEPRVGARVRPRKSCRAS